MVVAVVQCGVRCAIRSSADVAAMFAKVTYLIWLFATPEPMHLFQFCMILFSQF